MTLPVSPRGPSPGPSSDRIRWWPALLVGGLLVLFWVWVWFFEEIQRQDKNLQSMVSLLAALFLLFLWWLLFSRAPWHLRWRTSASLAVSMIITLALFDVKGVTGDFLPIIKWRWGKGIVPPVTSVAAAPLTARALPQTDYPQVLGPTRDGKVSGLSLGRDWAKEPPLELWRRPVGAAWSGFATSGRYAITMEQIGEEETAVCYDLLRGEPLWKNVDAAHYNTTIAGEGPRTVPAISQGKVVTLGATGILNCLDLTNGTLRWSKNILREHGLSLPDWGVSGSPLIYDKLVVVSPGGKEQNSLAAYDLETGELRWKAGSRSGSYSSPALFTFAGVRQVVIFNASTITGHDAASGQVLWDHPWPPGHPHISIPVAVGTDRLMISSGYGIGSELLQISRGSNGWAAKRLWKSNRLKSKFANLIVLRDHAYGLDDGTLACLDLGSGEMRWKDGRYGHGQMILAGDLLLIMAESGAIVLIEPDPSGLRELGRHEAFADKTWNPPSLAGRYLLVRNDREAACFLLPIKVSSTEVQRRETNRL